MFSMEYCPNNFKGQPSEEAFTKEEINDFLNSDDYLHRGSIPYFYLPVSISCVQIAIVFKEIRDLVLSQIGLHTNATNEIPDEVTLYNSDDIRKYLLEASVKNIFRS